MSTLGEDYALATLRERLSSLKAVVANPDIAPGVRRIHESSIEALESAIAKVEGQPTQALMAKLREFLTPISDMPNPDGRGRYAETTIRGAEVVAKSELASDILEILDGADNA